jgi:hypothetical protein
MLETLATTSEQIENAEPVSAHPDKLREQLAENKVLRCNSGWHKVS